MSVVSDSDQATSHVSRRRPEVPSSFGRFWITALPIAMARALAMAYVAPYGPGAPSANDFDPKDRDPSW